MKFNKTLKITVIVSSLAILAGCASSGEQASGTDTASASNNNQTAPKMVKPSQAESAAAVNASMSMSNYEVTTGDHLWGISAKDGVYGNPYKWPLIYKANSDQIKDADLIHPGQVLDINTNPSDAESSAAINHAKTRGSWSIGVTESSDKAYLAQ